MKYPKNLKHFAVKASGHGSGYRFNSGWQAEPTEDDLLTFSEAFEDAWNWPLISDTIGGSAVIYHTITKKEYDIPYFKHYLKEELSIELQKIILDNMSLKENILVSLAYLWEIV